MMLWKQFSIGWETISLLIGALAPILGLAVAVSIDYRRRKQIEKPPQEEKLLRPPGYSLALRLDEIQDGLIINVLWAAMWCALAGACATFVGKTLAVHLPLRWHLIPLGILAATASAGAVVAIRALRTIREAQNVRLGLRGEQAVAEALHELGPEGFRAFHDLRPGADWNIDHVAVGAKGVFLVETKARRKRIMAKNKPSHKMVYDGTRLQFPSGDDTTAVRQAERNARWLTDYLAKKTGEPVRVEPIIALPGWWVTEQRLFPVRVMNCPYLVKYLAAKPDVLTKEQVCRLVTALDEKCRTLDF